MGGQQRVSDPQGDARESIGAKIWRVFDTPVQDLSKVFLPHGRDDTSKVRGPEAMESTRVTSQSTFLPLVSQAGTSSETFHDPIGVEARQSVSIARCIASSIAWAWRAGPALVVTKVGASAVSAVIPYGIGIAGAKVIDSLVKISNGAATVSEAMQWFAVSAALSLVAVGTSLATRWADSRHRMLKSQEVMKDMRNALTGFSPVEQFSPEVTQLVNRTLQSQWAIQSFGEKLFELVVPSVAAVGAIAIVAPYSPTGAVLLGAFAVPYFYHSRKRGLEELAVSGQLAEATNRFGAREWSLLTGPAHIEMKLYGKTGDLLTHLQEERAKIDRTNMGPELNQQRRETWVQPLNVAAITGLGLVVLNDVAINVSNAGMSGPSIGEYGLIMGALFSLNGSIRGFASSIGDMLRNLPQAQVAHAVMQRGLARKAEQSQRLVLSSAPEIEIAGLRFSYPPTSDTPSPEVLKGVSFKIRPGELLGIVGESGSGKSSLVNLLCGIYEPQQGSIRFSGTDLSQVSKESLWASSGYLRQMSANFWSMTLRENILVGARRPLNDEQILAIAKRTGFLEVMNEDGLSLDTVLGQWFRGGKNLSGGQQALLAMTRQEAAEAKFMVLDEPTAGLDQRRSDETLARIRGLKDVTRIVISHDYGIASQADRILVLEKGEVADIGTHEELLQRCEIYRRACERQRSRLELPE